MEGLFIHVLNISITASFLVLAIILYRLFAKKAPKKPPKGPNNPPREAPTNVAILTAIGPGVDSETAI